MTGRPASRRARPKRTDEAAVRDSARAWMDDLSGRVLPALLDSLSKGAGGRPQPGDHIGGYRLESVIGEGGMGVVFRAHDERLDREVALKFLHRPAGETPDARRRVLDEARAAARLDHPGIAVVHEVGETDDGAAFIVMACHDGETLASRLDGGGFGIDEALSVGRHLADALAAAHRAGIVHRDVKPSNVVLAVSGGIRLVDFGLASRASAEATGGGRGLGTLPYMSPEQVDGAAVDARSDVWSLGVVMYEMLAGVRPFTARTPAGLIQAISTARATSLAKRRPEVPASLDEIVSRCLAKAPADRYRSAAELLAALTAVMPDWPGRANAGGGPADTASADALCREGRLLLDGGDPTSVGRARDAFLGALRARPDYARAWCGLSDAYEQMAYLAMLPPDEAHLRARAAAERALEIEPDLGEAHVSLATVLVDYYRDWSRAGAHYRRALALAPDYATGRQLYAEYLRDLGRFDEALEQIDEAIRLDPLSPFFRLVRGIVLHMARRQEESLEAFERLLEATPDYRMAHFYMSFPLTAMGQAERAIEALDRADPDGTFPDAISLRGSLLGALGQREGAENAIRRLRSIRAGHHVLPFQEAFLRLSLGEVDRALELFEEDVDRRTWFSRVLGVAPGLDPLRSHPRFQALLARVRGESKD